jgi:hypothetical protein
MLVFLQMRVLLGQVLSGYQQPVLMAERPHLPAVTQDILPGEGWNVGTFKSRRPIKVFDTWKPERKKIATMQTNAAFTLLAGLCVIDRPDHITVTDPVPHLSLKAGDEVLRYAERGEGNANFWSNGRWYRNSDLAFVANVDGSGCQSGCKARVIETGSKTRWFRIRLTDGRSGWTDAADGVYPDLR